ncbi:MAG: putative integral membrane protein [Methanobacterium sp. Maddingley MBC34]|nr:MAG: putative integral membrane protein [Methanobacterium sp. Maddingley MBC34]
MSQYPEGLLIPTRRLETLTDGLFAIAMTILVVTIQIPIGPIHTADLFVQTTSEIIPKFAVYFLSFLLLAVFWVDHHMFYLVKKSNFTLIWLNIFWLMFIALLPLSTSIIAQFPEYQLAQLIFDFNLLFIGLFFYIIWSYSLDRGLISEEVKPYYPYIKRSLLFMPIVISVTILFTFINPKWSMVILFMIPIFSLIGRKLWSHNKT